MARKTLGLILFASLCSCQEAPGHPGSSVTPTPMPQFVRDMLSSLAEGKRDFRDAENREYHPYQQSESQSGEAVENVGQALKELFRNWWHCQ